METDTILGVAVIVLSLSFTTYLILYSRKSIDKISDKNLTNVRQIMKELRDGR